MKTTELDKMKKVSEESQSIGNFLDWCFQKGWFFCKVHEHVEGCYDKKERKSCGYTTDRPEQVFVNIEKLLAEYYDIDLDKCEKERIKILEEIKNV